MRLPTSLLSLSLLSATLLALAAPARAQEPLVVKIGSVAPEGTPWADWLDGVKK
jgi:hypothetical protein